MLSIGSLFSGIGGLELGLEMAGLGPTLWQVEKDSFCRSVLAKHWPDVARFEDVQTVNGSTLSPVDVICGGFPCQDVSSAGTRAGLAGSRSGLWREFARIVGELAPEWVVVENVTSGANKWADAVVSELEQLGYACLSCPLSAQDVGAPHRRGRVFIVAHAYGNGQSSVSEHAETSQSSAITDADSVNIRNEPGGGIGQSGSSARIVADHGAQGFTPADSRGSRFEGHRPDAYARWTGLAADPWRSPVPGILRVADGVSSRLDQSRARIQALGNSVVPQCAEVIGWVIRELIAEQAQVAAAGRK